MWPVLMNILKRYIPYITLPFAGIIGVVGYHLEGCVSDRYTPTAASVVQQREERLLENLNLNIQAANKHKPLEVNLSPSLS